MPLVFLSCAIFELASSPQVTACLTFHRVPAHMRLWSGLTRRRVCSGAGADAIDSWLYWVALWYGKQGFEVPKKITTVGEGVDVQRP